MKKLLLIAAVAASATPLTAQLDLSVDPGATWIHYVNAFNVSGDAFAFGFAYGDQATNGPTTQAIFSGSTLSLGPNIGIYDAETSNAAWVNQSTLAPVLYTEVNTYYELDSAAGVTVNFDWETLSNDLASASFTPTNDNTVTATYDVVGFIKVLDPGAGWATVDSAFVSLATGAQGASLLVPATVGTPKIQVGFAVTGNILAGTDPNGSTYSTVTVPEPSTYAILFGFAALGLVMYRRRKA